jgi:hypothetical protein
MNANPEENAANSLPTWYDPFPKPRTIPEGWDLNEPSETVELSDSPTATPQTYLRTIYGAHTAR